MGLREMIGDIKTQAEAKEKVILREAKEEGKKILAEAEEKAKVITKAAEESAVSAVEALKKREIAAQKLHSNKEVLDAKKSALDDAYEKAEKSVRKMKQEDLLKQALSKTKFKAKYFYCRNSDRKAVEKLLPKLKFKGEVVCLGGVILEDEKGEVRENLTFDNVIGDVKEKTIKKVASQLFAK